MEVFRLCRTALFFYSTPLELREMVGFFKGEWINSVNGCLSIMSVSMVATTSRFFSHFKEMILGSCWYKCIDSPWEAQDNNHTPRLSGLLVNKWMWGGVKWGWVCTSRFQVGFPAVSPSRDARLRGSGKAGKTAPPALWPGGSCWRPPAHRLPQTACPLNGSSWTEYCGTQRPSRSFQLSCTVLSGLCSHIPVHCNPPQTASCLKETKDIWFMFRLRTWFYI